MAMMDQASSSTPESASPVVQADAQSNPPPNSIGWFGKLPGAGDFLIRRLPDDFRLPWDRWLSEGMLHGKAALGDQWEADFLSFPVWRFLWQCATEDRAHWTGVLLPGVDRVGRLFPLTVAMPLALTATATPGTPQALPALHAAEMQVNRMALSGLDDYLDEVQALALQVLADDDIAGFDAALRALPAFDACAQPRQDAGLKDWFTALGLRSFLAGPAMTLFWSRDPMVHNPLRIETCPPAALCFLELVTSIPAAESCPRE